MKGLLGPSFAAMCRARQAVPALADEFQWCDRETALEIASALAYLHDINILHGDLSGGNILLTSSSKDARKFTCKVHCPSPLPVLSTTPITHVWGDYECFVLAARVPGMSHS